MYFCNSNVKTKIFGVSGVWGGEKNHTCRLIKTLCGDKMLHCINVYTLFQTALFFSNGLTSSFPIILVLNYEIGKNVSV